MAEAGAEPQWDAAAGVWVGERAVGVSDDELPNPLWVFGYGSLCWRIDDPYEEIFDGKVQGWRRRMGQGSCDHRGTPELPGVVATLMPEAEWLAAGLALDGGAEGGAESVTHGVVYRVPEASAKEVIDNLDFREKGGYTKAVVDATSLDGSRSVRALIYTANSANPLFMGGGALQGTAPAEVAARIHRAVGPSGPNHEYLFALADYLRKVGANDPHVFGLEGQVKALRDADAAEGGAGGAAAAVGVSHTVTALSSARPQPSTTAVARPGHGHRRRCGEHQPGQARRDQEGLRDGVPRRRLRYPRRERCVGRAGSAHRRRADQARCAHNA